MTWTSVPRPVLAGSAPEVAPVLLNKLLVSTVDDAVVVGRITEVEAYTEEDPASHTFRGPTERNAVMFGPPGHLYVYLSYGIHLPINVVTGPAGTGEAVLVRALDLVDGHEIARRRRGGRADRVLTDGPGKLAEALGVERWHDGLDLIAPSSPIQLVDDGVPPPVSPTAGPRIGITRGVDVPWRFRV